MATELVPADTPESPPLPTRHTPVTPGIRASNFVKVLDTTLAHTMKKISWENFAACYPTIAAKAPGTLKAVQQKMVEKLSQLCKKEFNTIFESRNVIAKLNELDSLVSEAETRKGDAEMAGEDALPVPPHMLPANVVLAAHLAPHLTAHQSQLNARLQTSQSRNANLFEEIQRQRAEIESLLQLVENIFSDIVGANDALEGIVGELAKESRSVDNEMSNS